MPKPVKRPLPSAGDDALFALLSMREALVRLLAMIDRALAAANTTPTDE